MERLVSAWKKGAGEADIIKAISILKEKFASVDSFGPQQIVEFVNSTNDEERVISQGRTW